MSYDGLIRRLIDVTKKIMPFLEKELKVRWAMADKYPYYKNKLNGIRPDQVIYRIEPFNCFLGNVMKKQLYFAWPGKWKDMDIFDGAFVRIPEEEPTNGNLYEKVFKSQIITK